MIAFARPTPRRPAPARNFDGLVDALRPGELTLLAGCPGVGKTSLAVAIAERVAIDRGGASLFISLDWPKNKLSEAIISHRARVESERILYGETTQGERFAFLDAADEFLAAPLLIADRPDQRVDDVLAAAWAVKRCAAPSLLTVDSLQILEPLEPRRTRHQRIAETAKRLRRLARDLDVAVLCVSQISRYYEGGPLLLQHAGAPGRIADRVLLLDARQPGHVRLCQRKPRGGSIRLRFEPGLGHFEVSAK